MSIRRASALAAPAVLVAALVAACSGTATPTPTVVPTARASAGPTVPAVTPTVPAATPPAPTPVVSPAPGGSSAGIVIRATTSQALSPEYLFNRMPIVVITDDGRAITPGPQIEIYPGPLLPALNEQAISPAGVQKVLAAARAAGLLTPNGSFTGGAAMPGGSIAQLTIVADGTTYRLTGPASLDAPCNAAVTGCAMPTAGTPDAFAWFWSGLLNLQGWLASDLSADSRPYVAPGYALLVGPPPADAIPGNPIGVWPLKDQPLSSFGTVYSMAGFRCGSVTDAVDAAALTAVFLKANQLTAWVDDLTQSATRSITVRPLVPGDGDRCTSLE